MLQMHKAQPNTADYTCISTVRTFQGAKALPRNQQSMTLRDERLLVRPPDLVLSASGDVAHPRQRLVPALLNHLQVAHLRTDTRHASSTPLGTAIAGKVEEEVGGQLWHGAQ